MRGPPAEGDWLCRGAKMGNQDNQNNQQKNNSMISVSRLWCTPSQCCDVATNPDNQKLDCNQPTFAPSARFWSSFCAGGGKGRRGKATSMTEFKEAFGKYMRYKHRGVSWKFDDKDNKPYTELGYEVKVVAMCKSCGRKAQGGGDGRRCCADYGIANRANLVSIVGMEVVYKGEDGAAPTDPLD